MLCKKCGCNIEKDWKYCPNCSKGVHKERNIIIFSIIAFLIIIWIALPIIKNNLPMNA